jgi:hypothetical protein
MKFLDFDTTFMLAAVMVMTVLSIAFLTKTKIQG